MTANVHLPSIATSLEVVFPSTKRILDSKKFKILVTFVNTAPQIDTLRRVTKLSAMLPVLVTKTSMQTSSGAMLSPFKPHWDLYPLTYVAYKTDFPLYDNLDGDLTKDVWSDVPWSEYFDDIRGVADAPPSERPNANCTTRFKALWDDTHLYIGALIQTDFETVAEFTERNSPIFQKDSDFEVFIDPIGSCHWYKELEVNAINTIWNLMLDKPYGDGGSEHSARIAKPGEKQYYEVHHQRTAVKLLEGELNNPNSGTTWSLEIAISYKDIMAFIENNPIPPSAGMMWRINFSRVEHQGDINWTWQPQIAWNPKEHRFAGFVNMHLPDAWGYIVFGPPKGQSELESSLPRDPTWPARLAAMNIYYAQTAFYRTNAAFARDLDQLQDYVSSEIVHPFQIYIERDENDEFFATVTTEQEDMVVTVTEDRLVSVFKGSLAKSELRQFARDG